MLLKCLTVLSSRLSLNNDLIFLLQKTKKKKYILLLWYFQSAFLSFLEAVYSNDMTVSKWGKKKNRNLQMELIFKSSYFRLAWLITICQFYDDFGVYWYLHCFWKLQYILILLDKRNEVDKVEKSFEIDFFFFRRCK